MRSLGIQAQPISSICTASWRCGYNYSNYGKCECLMSEIVIEQKIYWKRIKYWIRFLATLENERATNFTSLQGWVPSGKLEIRIFICTNIHII